MTKSTTKAVAYLRVSGFGQVEGDGFPRQREACDVYARTNGLVIVDEYRDEACSGCTDADAREGFGAMIERIAGNGVRVVLVERADRLARDLIVSETLIGTLRKLGVRVIEACSGLDLTDTTDPSRILIRQVLGAVAEFNRREIVGKLAKARRRIRDARGRCEGRKPYGSNEAESAGLNRLLDLVHGQKLTYRQAAATLTSEGVPTRGGKPWTPFAVAKIAKRAASPIQRDEPTSNLIRQVLRAAAELN